MRDVPGIPNPSSPISNAVVVGDMCWISGQVAYDDDGKYQPGTVVEEARRAFALIIAIARAAGFQSHEIAFLDIAFRDLTDLTEVNRVYADFFPAGSSPARTVYEAARLPFDARIKVQAVCAR